MGCMVIWVGNDGAVTPHERLHFAPKGKAVGEVLLLLPEDEVLFLDGDGVEFRVDLKGNPPEVAAIHLARTRGASLTITAPLGFGLDWAVPAIKKAMKGYRRVKTQEFADPVSSAPENQQAFFRELGVG